MAKEGRLLDIPVDIRIKHYGKLKQIAKDYCNVEGEADTCKGIWIHGDAGVGKSRYARDTYPGAY